MATQYYRAPVEYFAGQLSSAAALSDTTINASVFANLPTIANSGTAVTYIPLVLGNPSTNAWEVVWVTAHAASATSVTVTRGKEGSAAQAWPQGTTVLCAPTIGYDGLATANSTALPADAHVGMRDVQPDTGRVVQQTFAQGWQPDVGVANPGDIGTDASGATIPSNAVMMMRGGYVSGTTDASGNIGITYKVPFPNATVAALLTSRYTGTIGPLVVASTTASSFTAVCYNGSATRAASATVTINYLALGY